MSAATTDRAVELSHEQGIGAEGADTPRHKAPAGSALEPLAAEPEPVIAVDMDDVLSQTNWIVAQWHNHEYGTNMDLSQFYYYHYWKNPYWGTPEETFKKVERIYAGDWLEKAPPVEGAREGVEKLRALGYRLVVVTARQKREMERSLGWLETHFPGIFETIICTDQSQETLADKHAALTKLDKAGVCHKLGAKLLIDDSLENALKCANATPPVPVLLFGNNEWNKRLSKYVDIKEEMSFEERLKKEGGREFWKDEEYEIPPGMPITRVKDWASVVRYVEQAKKEGRL